MFATSIVANNYIIFSEMLKFSKKIFKGGGDFMKKIRYHSALIAWTLIMLFSEILKFFEKNCFKEHFFCEGEY
jgi:hypothetical protein